MTKIYAAAAALCISLLATSAFADPFSGTVGIDIYQGPGNGNAADPNNQAVNTNPLINNNDLIGQVIYNGPINFSASQNTILSFLQSAGGTIENSWGNLNSILSTGNFGTTTVFTIFGQTQSAIDGTISHDDGASLYDASGTAVFSSPSPTTDISGGYSLGAGNFDLVYLEANGLPADLTMEVNPVPEPASIALLGIVLLGMTIMVRHKRA